MLNYLGISDKSQIYKHLDEKQRKSAVILDFGMAYMCNTFSLCFNDLFLGTNDINQLVIQFHSILGAVMIKCRWNLAGMARYLGVYLWLFMEEISVWIDEWVESSHPWEFLVSNLVRARREQGVEEGGITLPELVHLFPAQTPVLLMDRSLEWWWSCS